MGRLADDDYSLFSYNMNLRSWLELLKAYPYLQQTTLGPNCRGHRQVREADELRSNESSRSE